MADPDLQGTKSSNKTTNTALNVLGTSKDEASASALPSSWSHSLGHPTSDSSSDFPIILTVQRETVLEESHQNVPPPKIRHDTYMECGSATYLDSFSLRLANTEGEDEDMDKDDNNKRDVSELQEIKQKQTVTGIEKLEEKRATDIADAKSGDDISEVRPLRLFNFLLREIATAPHNTSSAINQPGEPSANTSSILPRSVQDSSSPCTIDYPAFFIGGEEQHKKTDYASFKRLVNSHSTFKTRLINTGKPPFPPGAVKHLKEGVAAKANKIHFLNMPQDSRKRIRLSESVSKKVVSAAEPDNEGRGERGNSNPPYGIAESASKGLAAKCGNSNKVTSSDNSSMEMVTLSDYILAGQPQSSVQVNSLPHQEVLVFGNFNVNKSLGNQGIGEGNRKNASTSDPKKKLFQLSKQCVTGNAHRQSFFEEERKHIQQSTIGESSCSNNGATLQVTSGSLQNTSGLLSTTFAPIRRGQESYGSLATSLGDKMPGNKGKYSSQNFFHFKSWKADSIQCDGERSSPVTLAIDKSKMTFSMQQAGSSPCSLQNIDRIQLKASGTSSTDSSSCEAIVTRNFKAKTERCSHIDRDQMNTMKRDYGSYNKTHLKGPVYLSQAERSKALQVSSESIIEQLHDNVSESTKGYRHGSGSHSIGAEFGKEDLDRIRKKPNQVNVDVCNLESQHEGTVLGAGSEVVLSYCERDRSNSKTENEHPVNISASRDRLVQRKTDAASVQSHAWIQRWRPSDQIASSWREMCCGSLTNKKFSSLPRPFTPMKMMPSAAAMAIVGIAGRQLPSCHLQKKGSFSVWTAEVLL